MIRSTALAAALLLAAPASAQVGKEFSVNDCVFQPFTPWYSTGEGLLISTVTCHVGPSRRISYYHDSHVAVDCRRRQVNFWETFESGEPAWGQWRDGKLEGWDKLITYVCGADQ